MPEANASGDETAILLLGGLPVVMGLVVLGIGVFLSFASPVQVTLTCDRATGLCSRSTSHATVPVSALATARHEEGDEGARIVVDHDAQVVALSNFTTEEALKVAQVAAIARMREFAASQEPTLSVGYPIGGNKPDRRFWLGVAGAFLFGAPFLREGLRRRASAARAPK